MDDSKLNQERKSAELALKRLPRPKPPSPFRRFKPMKIDWPSSDLS